MNVDRHPLHRRFFLLIPLLLIAMFCGAMPAAAEWSHDPYENNPVQVREAFDGNPQTVTDGRGGVITVWGAEDPPASGQYELRVQRVDGDGNLMWSSSGITIFDPVSGYIDDIAAASDENGGAYIATTARMGSYYRAMVLWVRYDGVLPWGTAGIELTPGVTGFSQDGVVVVSEGIDGCICVWKDARDYGSTSYDIWAQAVSTGGSLLWGTTGLEICGAIESQGGIAVAPDLNGGAYIAWEDRRDYATNSYDIYAQHVTGAGARTWTADGTAMVYDSDAQLDPAIVNDGFGGVIVAWEDNLSGDVAIYVARYTVLGDYWWSAYVSDETTGEYDPALMRDGQGGAYVAWRDLRDDGYDSYDIYVQHLDAGSDPRWTTNGVRAGAGNGSQFNPRIVSDGAGGIIVAWEDSREAGSSSPYAQRFNSGGARMWNYYGVKVGGGAGTSTRLGLVGDDRGGAIMVWNDYRAGYWYDIYAQRIDFYGYLGDPAPAITELADYPQDQGGVMILDWTPSYLDSREFDAIYDYSVWRQYGGMAKAAPVAIGGEEVALVAARTGLEPAAVLAQYEKGWSLVGEVEAFHFDEYSYHAASYGDWTEAEIPLTEYKVLAHTSSYFWESNVEVGYSVDNLAPEAPKNLLAVPVGADIDLDWSPSEYHAEDLASYRIYRAGYSGFVPDEMTFLASTADSLFSDVATGPGEFFYLVTGIDVHGNESLPSNEADATSLSAVGGLPKTVALRGNHPNPFNPATTISFDLPQARRVKLDLYTIDGRRIATLVDGVMDAGRRSVVWRGCGGDGRPMPSGTYFYRLEAGDYSATKRMLLLR